MKHLFQSNAQQTGLVQTLQKSPTLVYVGAPFDGRGTSQDTVGIVGALNIFYTYEKALIALLNVHVAEHFADKEISLGIPTSVVLFDLFSG